MFGPALVNTLFALYYFGSKRQVAIKQHTMSTSASLELNFDRFFFHNVYYTSIYLFGQVKKKPCRQQGYYLNKILFMPEYHLVRQQW